MLLYDRNLHFQYNLIFNTMKHLVFLCLFISVPLASGDLIAQETAEVAEIRLNFIQYHKLSLRNLETSSEFEKVSLPNELEIIPLSGFILCSHGTYDQQQVMRSHFNHSKYLYVLTMSSKHVRINH